MASTTYNNYYYQKQGTQTLFYGQDPGTGLYVQLDPNNNPLGNLNAIGDNVIKNKQANPLPSGGTTIPLGGVFNTGGGSFSNQQGNLVAGTGAQNLPSGSPTVNSPFSSSSGMDISNQVLSFLQGVQNQSQSNYGIQNQAIDASRQASISSIQAQKASGDAMYQAAINQALQDQQNSLGLSDVQAAILDPTGTQSSPAGPGTGQYASTAYTGLKADITKKFDDSINQLKSAQAAFDMQAQAGIDSSTAQALQQQFQAAQNSLQNTVNIMGQLFGVIESQQNYQLGVANYNAQNQYYQSQIAQGQQSQAYQNAQNIISGIQSSGKMTPAEQQQLQQYGAQLGMPSLVDIGSQAAQAGSATMATTLLDNAYKQAQIQKIQSDLGGGTFKSGGLVIPKATIGENQNALLSGTTYGGKQYPGSNNNPDGFVNTQLYTTMLGNWINNQGLVQDWFKQFPVKQFKVNTNDPLVPDWVKNAYTAAESQSELQAAALDSLLSGVTTQ